MLSICSILIYIFNVEVYMDIKNGQINIPGFIVSLSSIFVVCVIYKKIKSLKIIDYLGRRSLGLYFLSGSIPNICAIVLIKFNVDINFVVYILVSIFSFILACFVSSLLYKYIPFVFDFSKIKNYF